MKEARRLAKKPPKSVSNCGSLDVEAIMVGNDHSLARPTRLEPYSGALTVATGNPSGHPALERHYSLQEVLQIWKSSERTVIRRFKDEAEFSSWVALVRGPVAPMLRSAFRRACCCAYTPGSRSNIRPSLPDAPGDLLLASHDKRHVMLLRNRD